MVTEPETPANARSLTRQTPVEAPLIERVDGSHEVPSTWCVVLCEQGCDESWAVDTTDFEPALTASAVEQLLTPVLIAHEVEHGKW